MNIKKNVMKTMCAALAYTTIMGNMFAAFATDAIVTEAPLDSDGGGVNWTADEGSLEEIEVTYRQASSYNVTIPKTITLDSTKQAVYSVKVTGDIDTNERVHVVPVDGIPATENLDFYMKDQTSDSKKADVVAKVIQNKVYWDSEDVANGYEETNNSVSAPDLTAGNWKGTFQVAINLETVAAHVHDFVDGVCTGCGATDPNAGHEHKYVDGKCDCGAIDPDHTHNYEDGTCTICGKNDSYETAPATAYSNWNYTLDDANSIITLNYYTGSETDVVVYANYVIGDKTYKTQLKSNENSTANTPYMFNGYVQKKCKDIKSIIFSDAIDTSNVTDMNCMFNYCNELINLDISSFDTSNVKNMRGMFEYCYKLTDLDLSSFNTSNVTNMEYMFYNCIALTSLDLSDLDMGSVTTMKNMFAYCRSLINVDLSNFDTASVTDMSNMFDTCLALTSLDLSSFDTSNVTSMYYLFNQTPNLKTIYVNADKWKTSQADTRSMFSSCGTSEVTYK